MKKVSLFTTMSLAAIVLGSAVTVNAASEGVIETELKQEDTMKFEIKPGNADEIKDPEVIDDGGEPTDVKPGPLIPHKGNLAITAIPHLNFGEIKLGGKEAIAYQGLFESKAYKYDEEKGKAVIDESSSLTQYKPAIRVDDLRGTNAGWKLTAALGEIKSGNKELKGARLTFPSNTIKTNNVTDDSDLNDKLSNAVSLLANGTPNELLSAEKGTGRGANQVTYYLGTKDGETIKRDNTKEISLTVPAGSLVGSYSATVTYQLSELTVQTPAN